ncbi:MAG: radical SAM protein, partial [bacterium]|nr:radical SAM protein [bacterium]
MLSKIKDFYIQWHITERCNLRCSHCYQENYTSNDLEWDELKEIADIIVLTLKRWNKTGRIALTGGEPFFSKHLYKLLQFFNESECISYLTILSNGTMLTEEDISWLKRIAKLKEIQISLDGAIPETHNKIRGENVFEKVIENIRLLQGNNMDVTLMYTLHRDNVEEVPLLIDLAIRESVNGITVERITPCGTGRDLKNLVLSPLERGFRQGAIGFVYFLSLEV